MSGTQQTDISDEAIGQILNGGTVGEIEDTDEDNGSVPDDVMRESGQDIVAYAENLLKINGDPLDYSGEYRFWKEPLRAVVDSDTERIHIWKKARGLGKTTQGAIPETYLPATERLLDAIHTVTRADQLNSYMTRQIGRMVDTSAGDPPVLRSRLTDNRIAVKRNEWTTGSYLEGRSAWGDGRSIQGFHGSYGSADEIQNWSQPAIQNLKEAIDEPLPGETDSEGGGRILMTGTPDYEGTIYHEHWKESSQHTWHYTCPSCGVDQTIVLDSVQVTGTDPKSWGLFCRQPDCGENFDKTDILLNGFWEATKPNAVHRGYTFNQLLSPRHNLDSVMRDLDLASTSKADFMRYKLARFWSGGSKPIPPAALYACCDATLGLHERQKLSMPHFAGIDFGGGENADTFVVVLTVSSRERSNFPTGLVIRAVERIEYQSRTEELRKVADCLDRFGIGDEGRAVADMGYGSAHVDAMQNGDSRDNAIPSYGWGSSVMGHRFGNVDRKTESTGWDYLKRDGRKVVAYQPPWANKVFDLFPDVQGYDDIPDDADDMDYDVGRTPDKHITIPYVDSVKTKTTIDYWFDHLSSIKREFTESKSGNRKERITTFQSNQKDDGFYALLYALTAACLKSTSSRGGYMNISGRTA